MPDQSGEERPRSADAAVLKDEIDSGRTRDKVPWFDPGAAPLGTDAESAGNSPTASASTTDSPASQAAPARDSGNDRAVYELQDRLMWPVIIGLCALLAIAVFLFAWFRV
jgi:hypothetical protein